MDVSHAACCVSMFVNNHNDMTWPLELADVMWSARQVSMVIIFCLLMFCRMKSFFINETLRAKGGVSHHLLAFKGRGLWS